MQAAGRRCLTIEAIPAPQWCCFSPTRCIYSPPKRDSCRWNLKISRKSREISRFLISYFSQFEKFGNSHFSFYFPFLEKLQSLGTGEGCGKKWEQVAERYNRCIILVNRFRTIFILFYKKNNWSRSFFTTPRLRFRLRLKKTDKIKLFLIGVGSLFFFTTPQPRLIYTF